jgi:hypothetical protein
MHNKQPQINSTPEFMWKPKWEKTTECFLIFIKNKFIGSTNLKNIQHQLEGGSNPLFVGSNRKEATNP